MANNVQFNQSNFNRGEIDGLLGARFDYEDYDKALKKARNVLTLPQGGVTSRFGTKRVNTYAINNPNYIDMACLLYNDSAVFVCVFYATHIDVYLENILLYTITSQPYQQEDIINIRFSQVENRLIITNPNYNPRELQITTGTARTIAASGAGTSTLTLTAAALTTGTIFPITFNPNGGVLPVMSPVIHQYRAYYAKALSATTVNIYDNPTDAALGQNVFTISVNASGSTPQATPLNSFTCTAITFTNMPSFDPTGDYLISTATFKPSAVTGASGIQVAATGYTFAGPFNDTSNKLVGGVFSAGGGAFRITNVKDAATLEGYVTSEFPADPALAAGTSFAFNGQICFIGQQAWSDTFGWPRVSNYFQGRLFFAGNSSSPNGIWGSTVNEVYNFDDSEVLDSSAITYYPASGTISYIQALSSARSLLVHTNTGCFSTALSTEQALTPTNVSFTEQNKDGSSALQPIFIDNQVIFIDKSYNNVKNLIWEISQSSYILRNISIVSTGLIRNPVDLANYSNPKFIDGSYVMVVNGTPDIANYGLPAISGSSDGTLAVFNTLYMENVAGWTLQNTSQWRNSTGLTTIPNYFARVASSFERIWFLVLRQEYQAGSTFTISTVAWADNALITSSAINLSETLVYEFTFTGGTLPTSLPQVVTNTIYYARQYSGNTTNGFIAYTNYDDAAGRTNPITLSTTGSSATVVFQTPTWITCLEELDFTVSMDYCTSGTIVANALVVPNLSAYNGQWVYVVQVVVESLNAFGEGSRSYVMGPYQIKGGVLTGLPVVTASNVYIGYPFKSEIQFLPINILLATGSNFYRQKSLRHFYLYYYNTIGAKINGVEFAVYSTGTYPIDAPTTPQTGIVDLPPMLGWEPLDQIITITQDLPLPLTVLGYSAAVEVT